MNFTVHSPLMGGGWGRISGNRVRRSWIHSLVVYLIVVVTVLFLAPLSILAQEEVLPGRELPPVSGQMDFRQCVKASLEGSHYLTSSSLEIDLKRLDEKDAVFAFIPSFSLRTSYWLNQPQANSTARPYSIQFLTETYNPIEIYFNMRARQYLTRMAVLAHMQVITDYLQRLGAGFLELESLERMASLLKEGMDLAEQAVAYARVRQESGGLTELEVRTAEQDLEAARLELVKLDNTRRTILEGIAGMIGPGGEGGLELELNTGREQVLGHFDPSGVSLEDARRNSYELQIVSLRRELQDKNITLAYTRFLPTFIWGVQTTDPFSANEEKGLFFSVGFDLPLWDGLKRYHNIARQKTLLRQQEAEGKSKIMGFDTKWSTGRTKLTEVASSLNIARSQQELAELRERQTAIAYNAGRSPLSSLLLDRKAVLEARKRVLTQRLEYDKAVLTLRTLSGDLIRNYVEPTIE